MKLDTHELAHFNADEGGWSKVTRTERKNKQITLTLKDGEWNTVVNAVGEENIPRQDSSRKFPVTLIKHDGTEVKTSMVIEFAKETGKELRMYPAKGDGFHFEVDDVGFVFRRKRKLFVGFLREHEWDRFARIDLFDDVYQEAILNAGSGTIPVDSYYISKGGIRISRNPQTALRALKKADFKCEYDPATKLFISRATARYYVEAHHFIPLFSKKGFNEALDIVENIVSLSPHWHRAVHHADNSLARRILLRLSKKPVRQDLMSQFGLGIDDLYSIYGI